MWSFWTLNPSRPDLGRREKVNLNVYFNISLWFLKRFYKGFKGHKPFEAPRRSVKMKIKILVNFYLSLTF